MKIFRGTMIKFKGKNENKKPVLGLGLSNGNIQALVSGRPILINEPEFFDGEILIMHGATEQHIVNQLGTAIDKGVKMKKSTDGN
jgi:hypothetical protein